jgi:hypothetical protein
LAIPCEDATGCGYPGDEKAEAMAATLAIDAQADLIAAIFRLMSPAALDPYVEK